MSGLLPAVARRRQILRRAAAGVGVALIVVVAWLTFEALQSTNQPPSASPSH